MKKVSISDAKNVLSALIDRLIGGLRLLIADRGRPVARPEPVTSGGNDKQNARLSRLVREGVVRPGRVALLQSVFSDQPPRLKGDASVVAALLEERRDGR